MPDKECAAEKLLEYFEARYKENDKKRRTEFFLFYVVYIVSMASMIIIFLIK